MTTQLCNLFTERLKESLFKTPIMTILNKLVWISLNTLKLITTQNRFTLLWAGAVLCSLKYKILKSLTSCPVFIDLSKEAFLALSVSGGIVQIRERFFGGNPGVDPTDRKPSTYFNLIISRISSRSTTSLLGATGVNSSFFFLKFRSLTNRKIEKAIIRKSTIDCINEPYRMADSGISPLAGVITYLRSAKLTPPKIIPIAGISTSLTSELKLLTESESVLIAMYRLLDDRDRETIFDLTKMKYEQTAGERGSIYSTYSDTNSHKNSGPEIGYRASSVTA